MFNRKAVAKAYLLLGSNTGNTIELLGKACAAIEAKAGAILSISSIYETEPWGFKEQAVFLNQLLVIETHQKPHLLLETLLSIEKELGRKRIEKWGPRTIDIDMLYYDSDIIVTETLKIPHPEIQNRKFVLYPLTEIAPDYIHPVFNINNKELLIRCNDTSEVKMKE